MTQFDNIDLSKQFFKQIHYNALRPQLWNDYSPAANKERHLVVKRLIELHQIIHPQFKNFGLTNIFEHYYDQNLTSSYVYKEGFSLEKLNAIWLHYSKSHSEIQEYEKVMYGTKKERVERNEASFSNHIRLQVIVHNNDIGVWLFVGKANNGSVWDRDYFQKSLNNDRYLHDFFSLIKSLGLGYQMYIGKEQAEILNCNEVTDTKMLKSFWQKDSPRVASYIGVTYDIIDERISAINIANTVLSNFAKLYPIYELMKHKFNK